MNIGDLFDSPWKVLIIAALLIVFFGARKLPVAASLFETGAVAACPGQSALHRPQRPAKAFGGHLVGQALEVAEHDRQSIALLQPVDSRYG